MFVVFEFLICDIFVCTKAISTLVPRHLPEFSVFMFKSFTHCCPGIYIIKSYSKYLSFYFFKDIFVTLFMHV